MYTRTCKFDEKRTLVRTLLELSLHGYKDDLQYIIFYLVAIQRRTFKYQQNSPPFSSLLMKKHESRVKPDVTRLLLAPRAPSVCHIYDLPPSLAPPHGKTARPQDRLITLT